MKRFAPHLAGVAVVALLTALSELAFELTGVFLVVLVGLAGWPWDDWRGADEQPWSSRAGDPTMQPPRFMVPAHP